MLSGKFRCGCGASNPRDNRCDGAFSRKVSLLSDTAQRRTKTNQDSLCLAVTVEVMIHKHPYRK